ncbi:berberine bridge enzyme-like 23 [Cocos nucifera]|nr:berberine bridge enzyme-like 23 [Cocos nucifera]
MSSPVSPYLLALLSVILFSTSSYATPPISNITHESILQCLLHHSVPHNLIYTKSTTSYTSLLQSSIQNQRFDTPTTPKPFLIVSPTLESHVQSTVKCSHYHGLQIRVRSGGHDYEGLSYVSHDPPFIVLDLHSLSSISIDTSHSTSWVQAGATIGELYYRIAEKNKTAGFPAGLCPTLGIGGHLSGGGFGTMVRMYGLAADHIIDARLVNADGEILDRESMGEDFFWAIRGGGAASFGVILAYKIKLVYVPPKVTVFTKSTNLSHGAKTLTSKWQQIAYKLDDRLFIRAVIQVASDEKPCRTIQVGFESLFLGEKEELLALMGKSFPELGLKAEDCQEMSWIQSVPYFAGYKNGESPNILLDRKPQFNISFKAKSDFLTERITELGWERIWQEMLRGEEQAMLIVDPYGGRMDEIPESETPFPHRKGSLYNIQYLVGLGEGGAKEMKKHLDWVRSFYQFMTPYVSKNPRAAYLNYRDLDLGSDRVGSTTYTKAKVWGRRYFKSNFERLAVVKGKVDPGNFFRNEQSVPPLFPA